MSPEILQIIFPLAFLGVCFLVGEILVQGHRDRVAAGQVQPRQRSRRKAREKVEVRA
jgi:hypothetical protein